MASKTLSEKLESARLLIYNSQDAAVAPLLNTMGIDRNYIERGKALYQEVMQLMDKQKEEYRQQSLAYDKFYLEKDDAASQFNRTLKLIRILSRNDEDLQNRLGLQARILSLIFSIRKS